MEGLVEKEKIQWAVARAESNGSSLAGLPWRGGWAFGNSWLVVNPKHEAALLLTGDDGRLLSGNPPMPAIQTLGEGKKVG